MAIASRRLDGPFVAGGLADRHHGRADLAMTEWTSAKSRLMSPSIITRSVMHATPEWSTSSAMAKASTTVVWWSATRKGFGSE